MVGRKKLDRTNIHARVGVETADKLKEIAQKLGYIYNDEGSTGQLLDAIATEKIILIHKDRKLEKSTRKYLYLAEVIFPDETFIKIGITGLPINKRFPGKKYQVNVINQVEDLFTYVLKKEEFILTQFAQFSYRPINDFDGRTECFTSEVPITEIIEIMNQSHAICG
ncbi:hypothetical protein [Nostoc sp. MG11]|uniref:hypothetical protein n=1 Tax=Nostoc sp. MG11 TaxID=2721166 RepID=UPI00186610C2|nr:hypothetical protein [Nostoc sp. MG11]